MPELVKVLRVTDVEAGQPGVPGPNMIAITYSTSDVPPRTVFIDKAKDTPQERQRVIKEDLEAARANRGTTLELS